MHVKYHILPRIKYLWAINFFIDEVHKALLYNFVKSFLFSYFCGNIIIRRRNKPKGNYHWMSSQLYEKNYDSLTLYISIYHWKAQNFHNRRSMVLNIYFTSTSEWKFSFPFRRHTNCHIIHLPKYCWILNRLKKHSQNSFNLISTRKNLIGLHNAEVYQFPTLI